MEASSLRVTLKNPHDGCTDLLSPVRTDQHIQGAQCKVFQRSNGFIALDGEFLDLAHGVASNTGAIAATDNSPERSLGSRVSRSSPSIRIC